MTDIKSQNYYSGTSGLLLTVPNKMYYPEDFQDKSRLCYYASLVNSIEINSSFYKIPQATTVKKWAADVTADFRFTFKIFKGITHNKDLFFEPALVADFMQVIENVGVKKACLLVQFPPSIKINHFMQLRNLMAVLQMNNPSSAWNIALEFRHPSLYVDEVYDLLAEYNLGMVIHDKKPASSPVIITNNDFVYLRFHGPEGNYRSSYPDDVLYEYASYINEWRYEGKKVYTYFNNTMGEAHANLKLLRQLVLNQ